MTILQSLRITRSYLEQRRNNRAWVNDISTVGGLSELEKRFLIESINSMWDSVCLTAIGNCDVEIMKIVEQMKREADDAVAWNREMGIGRDSSQG